MTAVRPHLTAIIRPCSDHSALRPSCSGLLYCRLLYKQAVRVATQYALPISPWPPRRLTRRRADAIWMTLKLCKQTRCRRAAATVCPRPSPHPWAPNRLPPPSRCNVAVVSHAPYVLTVTAAPASRVKAAVSKAAW